MFTLLKQHWDTWLRRQRMKTAVRQLRKRRAVLENGIHLYAEVVDYYPTRVSAAQQLLVRLQLRITLLNNTSLYAIAYAFVNHNYKQLKDQQVRIKFLPGDLSHVVVTI
jgi:hypothetical protein